jgi:hypothetical protein
MTPEIKKLVFNLRHKPPVGEPITSEHLTQAADLIEALVKERDEARREVCDMEGETAGGALLEARERGWDCFKERNEEDDDGIGYDPHTEAWVARAEEGKKREEEYRKRHEERIAWIDRVREEEAKKRQKGYPPF